MTQGPNLSISSLLSRWKEEGLETICKQIYPKTYQFLPKVKSLKFRIENFCHSSMRVIDNGVFLAVVIGDTVP